MEKDYRVGKKVVATLKIEDKGQDFTEIDILENGVILGNSIFFKNGRLSLLGIGSLNGSKYFGEKEVIQNPKKSYKGLCIYIYETGTLKPMPWNAKTLNYKIIGTRKVTKTDRFIKK